MTNVPQPPPPSPLPETGVGLFTKVILGAVLAALLTYQTALTDGVVHSWEWLGVGGSFLAALVGIWALPMVPAWMASYGKAILSGVIGLLGSLGTGLLDGLGLSPLEITTAVIALLLNSGVVALAPNALSSDPVNPITKKQIPIPAEVKEELATTGTTTTVTRNGVVTVTDASDGL